MPWSSTDTIRPTWCWAKFTSWRGRWIKPLKYIRKLWSKKYPFFPSAYSHPMPGENWLVSQIWIEAMIKKLMVITGALSKAGTSKHFSCLCSCWQCGREEGSCWKGCQKKSGITNGQRCLGAKWSKTDFIHPKDLSPKTMWPWLSIQNPCLGVTCCFPSDQWLREMCRCTGSFSHPIAAPQCPPILILGHSQALPVLSNVALLWRPTLERKSGVCWEPGVYWCSVSLRVCPHFCLMLGGVGQTLD